MTLGDLFMWIAVILTIVGLPLATWLDHHSARRNRMSYPLRTRSYRRMAHKQR